MPPIEKSGRQIIMEYLNKEICRATTGDLQRAARFLEFARETRSGCKNQRSRSRRDMRTSALKKVDDSISW